MGKGTLQIKDTHIQGITELRFCLLVFIKVERLHGSLCSEKFQKCIKVFDN